MAGRCHYLTPASVQKWTVLSVHEEEEEKKETRIRVDIRDRNQIELSNNFIRIDSTQPNFVDFELNIKITESNRIELNITTVESNPNMKFEMACRIESNQTCSYIFGWDDLFSFLLITQKPNRVQFFLFFLIYRQI